MLIQIHILQSYAPANLNRDDTGSPKDAMFGGSRRGRISSQCLKRSIRKSTAFAEAFEKEDLLGVRTKSLPDLIGKELKALGADEETIQAIVQRVPDIGRKKEKEAAGKTTEEGEKEEEKAATKQLIFMGINEIRPLAKKLLNLYKESGKKWPKVELEKELSGSVPRSVDIAMFGRMTTSEAFENVQAAVQVAHAISTHALTEEFDYYTAVDDLSGESGAGMIGDVEFNSSTYYKYFNVHWETLVDNLGGDKDVARKAIQALLEAAATAQPSGKQNSFAANSLPDLVLVESGEKNLPVSYANAFLKPVRAGGDKSLMDASIEAFQNYLASVTKAYNLTGRRSFMAVRDCSLPDAQAQPTLNDLKQWVVAQLQEK
jgi:CRISPR system Cascade subunit CasC